MKIKKSLLMLIFSFALLGVTGSSCQSKKMEEKYDWSGTLSAPEEYPIEVYAGSLVAKDYTQNFKNWGVIKSGWGDESGTVVAGPEKKDLPESLSITWFSFIERKFYILRSELPKEKIAALFKEGYTNDLNKHKTYTNIVIGLAPGGTVVVWLTAPGKEVEVAHFKARQTTIDPESIPDDSKYMFRKGYVETVLSDPLVVTPQIKDKIAANGYPELSNYDENYRIKYNWKPQFELPDGAKAKSFSYALYNGEMDKLFGDRFDKNEVSPKAVPRHCSFYWSYIATNEQHGVKVISFDEKEIMDAFKNVGSANIQFLFKVAHDNTVFISLKTDNKQIELKKTVVKVF
jgi:hypothetical protein